jgi:hypothetical protein
MAKIFFGILSSFRDTYSKFLLADIAQSSRESHTSNMNSIAVFPTAQLQLNNIQREKRVDESYGNANKKSKHIENDSGIRPRKARRVSRHNYGNAIDDLGRNDSDDESMSTQIETNNGLGSTHRRHNRDRRHIRRKLKQKSTIPGHVAWTKWMNSNAKNRMLIQSRMRCCTND